MADAASAGGSVNVTDAVVMQPFASVTVTVYDPAISAVAVAPVPPAGAHEYEYGAVPPEAVTVAEPLLPPKQRMFAELVIVAPGPPVFATFAVAVVVHPLASVIVTVYDPAISPVAVAAVPPAGVHEYEYGAVPPEAVTVAEPFGLPQVAGVAVVEAVSAGGWVMV